MFTLIYSTDKAHMDLIGSFPNHSSRGIEYIIDYSLFSSQTNSIWQFIFYLAFIAFYFAFFI